MKHTPHTPHNHDTLGFAVAIVAGLIALMLILTVVTYAETSDLYLVLVTDSLTEQEQSIIEPGRAIEWHLHELSCAPYVVRGQFSETDIDNLGPLVTAVRTSMPVCGHTTFLSAIQR